MKKSLVILIILISINLSAQEKKETKSIPEGYGSVTWGALLSAVRDNIRGKLVFTDEKSVIVSKENELKYTYGFFYVDPEKSAAAKPAEEKDAAEKQKTDEGKLFFVILSFPYLSLSDVQKKYEEKYGTPSIENIEKNQGAIAWNDAKSIIVIWVDDYEGKPYCRRVSYVSKDIAKEVNDYTFTMFNKTEIELIKALMP
ncbi:MAG TPA: hypothetical protein PK926_05775 [Spirochaetota bacterium]|nr:hypothetical protein [Spirochaetota bacterium]HPI87727.1 hypothetical protein [Spirochaetota bacterium]HPR48148.1 hypothetical protein [Spirochaetota bacterium]